MPEDLFEYNIEEIQGASEMFAEARVDLERVNNEYLEYIEENLVPNWNTESGVIAVKGLKDFLVNSRDAFSRDLKIQEDKMNNIAILARDIDNA